MIHDKSGLYHLAELMKANGIHHLVVSPGSRNAPVITVFCNDPGFQCISIVDERSAAFFAMGMALALNEPVAIVCTSGSAALNYAPAIAEAYYQHVPLLVLTADRPVEWIDQADGQTIRQRDVFAGYVRKSVELPQETHSKDALWFNDRLVSEALNALHSPAGGPVHINLPFAEPLYGFGGNDRESAKRIQQTTLTTQLTAASLELFRKEWESHPRKLILAGQFAPHDEIADGLNHLACEKDVVVLTESTTNAHGDKLIQTIDRCLSVLDHKKADYTPDMLITLGGQVVSKRIKSFLRKAAIKTHWHIDPIDWQVDTYQHLTHGIQLSASDFLKQILPLPLSKNDQSFFNRWQQVNQTAKSRHQTFLSNCSFTDLKVFETVFEATPSQYDIHLANSTPVRYAQLFDHPKNQRFLSNRGTSGIDGCTSTAAGFCFVSDKPSLLITGDLAFFYDSNALWNPNLPKDLHILLINNQGGGIFRYIDGPDTTNLLETYFEARHQTSARHLASAYQLDYYEAADLTELKQILPTFLAPHNRAVILEVHTPPELSADTLRAYFDSLAQDIP